MDATNQSPEREVLIIEDVKPRPHLVKHAKTGEYKQCTNMLIIWKTPNRAEVLKLDITSAETLMENQRYGVTQPTQPKDGNTVMQSNNLDNSFLSWIRVITKAMYPLVQFMDHQFQLTL